MLNKNLRGGGLPTSNGGEHVINIGGSSTITATVTTGKNEIVMIKGPNLSTTGSATGGTGASNFTSAITLNAMLKGSGNT